MIISGNGSKLGGRIMEWVFKTASESKKFLNAWFGEIIILSQQVFRTMYSWLSAAGSPANDNRAASIEQRKPSINSATTTSSSLDPSDDKPSELASRRSLALEPLALPITYPTDRKSLFDDTSSVSPPPATLFLLNNGEPSPPSTVEALQTDASLPLSSNDLDKKPDEANIILTAKHEEKYNNLSATTAAPAPGDILADSDWEEVDVADAEEENYLASDEDDSTPDIPGTTKRPLPIA